MTFLETHYLPADRFHSLAVGSDLPLMADGSALFADISGFTPVTERLRMILGARRGAEELAAHLNRVYEALIAQVDRYGGSIIGFAGDAITCWFGGEAAAVRATACGFALLDAMRDVEQITLPDGGIFRLGLKAAVTSGTTKRFVVGDPAIQLIDVLAGATVARIAVGEALAERGELLADVATLERLGNAGVVREWRGGGTDRFAVLEPFEQSPELASVRFDSSLPIQRETLFPWMLPALVHHIRAGMGEFPIELRPVTALFLRFSGINYDDDTKAAEKLSQLVRQVQAIVHGYEGSVLQLTIGDKGSYLYAAFGAPFAHEDDAVRALNAAIGIREAVGRLGYLDPAQIGISRGIMRTGAYGSSTRRTYGVLGDEVNLAARLMSQTEPGTILLSESLLGVNLDGFALESLTPIEVKGKANPIRVFRLTGLRERSFEARFYTSPMVGRGDELTKLHAVVQPVFEGRHSGVTFVYGEPGMGKSRLAFELQQRLQQDGANVTWLTGQADALSRAPFSAFAYFLRHYFGQQRDRNRDNNMAAFETAFDDLLALADETTRADLVLYRSFLTGVVGLVIPNSPYDKADEKLRIDNTIAAIKAWARAESRRQPLIIHLEDAQWLDAVSIRVVQQLTYNMETVALALLLTSRYNDDGTPFTISDVYSVPVHTFDLNRMSDEGVRAVAEAVLNRAISDELARFVCERAEGNPFFTEQLALDLKDRGVLDEAAGVWDLRQDATAEVPSNVNAVLIARLDRLTAQVRAVVQTAAVLGREFDVQILSRMLREGEQVYIQVAEGEAIWSALDQLRYLFRHALLRNAAYDMQTQERLRILHRLAAETIEALYPDDETQYDALLEHWQSVPDTNKILYYTLPICERLIDIAAEYTRAERLLQAALTLDHTPSQAVLLRLLGDGAEQRGDYPAAITYYEACLARADGDIEQHIRALDGLGKVYMVQGDLPAAVKWSEQALSLAREAQNQVGVAHAVTTLGNTAYQQGNYPFALTCYNEALQLYRTLNVPTGIVTCLTNLGAVAMNKGNVTEARAYLEECLALSQELGDRQRVSIVLNSLGNLAIHEGDFVAAHYYYEGCLNLKREIGARLGIGSALGNLAIAAIQQGKLVDAQRYASASLSERRAIGDRRGVANALTLLASIAGYHNEYAESQRYQEEALEIQRAINDRWGISTTLYNLSELARLKGQYSEAQVYSEECLTLARELEQPWNVADALFSLGKIADEQGEQARARQFYQEALNIQKEINNQHGIATCLINLGSLDMQLKVLDEAERQLQEASVILRTVNDRNLSLALATLAAVKHKQGQPQAAVYHLMREALTISRDKTNPDATHSTLLALEPILFADKKYEALGEMIGLLQVQTAAHADRLAVDQALNDLRLQLDVPVLDAALERGRMSDLDSMIEKLLGELA